MNIWHLTTDAPRLPDRVSPGERIILHFGTWPIELGQEVEVIYWVEHIDRTTRRGQVEAIWRYNNRGNSYWQAEIGPFAQGDHVAYAAYGRSRGGGDATPASCFRCDDTHVCCKVEEHTVHIT